VSMMDLRTVRLIVLTIEIDLVHVLNTGVHTDLHIKQDVNQTVQKKVAN
jgi:hypothetical protein